jgi:flagellar basal body rod protein FlgB
LFSSNVTLDLIAGAVDLAAFRHGVHSANIANAEVPGFRRLEVAFESLMDGSVSTEPEGRYRVPVAIPTDTAVRLDQEMAAMATNGLRYQALLAALQYTLSGLRNAAREGRGG